MTAAVYATLIALGYATGRYRPWLRLRNTARWELTRPPGRWARTRLLAALVTLADELAIAYWRTRRSPQPDPTPVPVMVVRPERKGQ